MATKLFFSLLALLFSNLFHIKKNDISLSFCNALNSKFFLFLEVEVIQIKDRSKRNFHFQPGELPPHT